MCHETGKRHQGTPFGWNNHFAKVTQHYKSDWRIKGVFDIISKGLGHGPGDEYGYWTGNGYGWMQLHTNRAQTAKTGDRNYHYTVGPAWGLHLEEVYNQPEWWFNQLTGFS